MGKQDYREAIEKGRQEINLHSNSAPSRRVHRKTAKEKPQKKKSILLPTLFFLFILIPVALLIYVAFLYEPNDTLTASSVNNEVSLESQAPETPLVPAVIDEEEEEPSSAEQQADEETIEKTAEQQANAEKEAELEEQAAEAQAQREREQAEAKRQEEQAEAKRQQEAAAEQKKQQEEQSAAKTHTVQPGETLYRIAVNTYGASGASAGVEKIKQANGLSSNEISVGATLILP